jgi:hypothetical protein
MEPPTLIATSLPTFIVRKPVTLKSSEKNVINHMTTLKSFFVTHHPEPAPMRICLVADFFDTSPKRRSRKFLASSPTLLISLLISFLMFFLSTLNLDENKNRKRKMKKIALAPETTKKIYRYCITRISESVILLIASDTEFTANYSLDDENRRKNAKGQTKREFRKFREFLR